MSEMVLCNVCNGGGGTWQLFFIYVRSTLVCRLKSNLQTVTLRHKTHVVLFTSPRSAENWAAFCCEFTLMTNPASWTIRFEIKIYFCTLWFYRQQVVLFKLHSYCTCRLLSCRPGGWCGMLTRCVPAWSPPVSPSPPNSKLLSPAVHGVP